MSILSFVPICTCHFVNPNSYIQIVWYKFVPVQRSCFLVGIDAMTSKSKKKTITQKKSTERKHRLKKDNDDPYARRWVSQRAPSTDQTCPMRLCVFLSNQYEWHLQTNSCLHHKHHPKLEEEAMTLSQKDLSEQQQSLINVLCDHKVPPSTICKVLSTLNDDDKGTFIPKFVFNFNEKSRNLVDVANGILPTCSDAEKTI